MDLREDGRRGLWIQPALAAASLAAAALAAVPATVAVPASALRLALAAAAFCLALASAAAAPDRRVYVRWLLQGRRRPGPVRAQKR